MSETWIHKTDVKKLLDIREDDLLKLVCKKVLTPYTKTPNRDYIPMEDDLTEYRLEEQPITRVVGSFGARWTEPYHTAPYLVPITKGQIKENLRRDYVWFNENEIDDAAYEGKISLPSPVEKPIKKQDIGETKPLIDAESYVKSRRLEGATERAIAWDLALNHQMTAFAIGKLLGMDKKYNASQVKSMTRQVRRMIQKERETRDKKVAKNKNGN